MNVLLIGEEAAAARILRALSEAGDRVVAVMASPDQPERPGTSLWDVANKMGYATWPADLVTDPQFAGQVSDAGVDVILNVHSLFRIARQVLEAPRVGGFNLHPGPLPRYAGLNSVCWAIYRGERQHGVTLHWLDPAIDAGPIAYQELFTIDAEETGLTLMAKCVHIEVQLAMRLLETARRAPSDIPSIAQDPSKREYFGRRVPENGNVSWSRPARQIVDFVRAADFFPFHSPWGPPRARLRGSIIGITKAALTGARTDAPSGTVSRVSSRGAEVACGDEWILVRQVFQDGRHRAASLVLEPGDMLGDGVAARVSA